MSDSPVLRHGVVSLGSTRRWAWLFEATFTDTGAIGPSKGDGLNITLTGGAYDGYTFNEVLDGGNLTVVS